jgi:VWFA-related protein
MPRSFRCILGLAFTVFCATLAIAQTSQPTQSASAQQPAPSGLTLHSSSQLVVVDVVVTDKQNKAVHNLKASDFTMLEKKVPQQIRTFEEHTAPLPTEIKNLPHLPAMPPGIFTNFSPVPPNSALNILLIDALNTSLDDQPFMRALEPALLSSV